MKKFLILFLMFVATPAMANIACGDSKDCNDKSTAAQKCADLGYSLNKVENCEHYLKCPFDTQYQKCVKYPKISCQSLGFTQTNACDSNQKQLTCTDSDGSQKYQCLENTSKKTCKSMNFLNSSSNITGCNSYVLCQEDDGQTYRLCADGEINIVKKDKVSTCGTEEYLLEEDMEYYGECNEGEIIVWGYTNAFGKETNIKDFDDYPGTCFPKATKNGPKFDEDCECSPCSTVNGDNHKTDDYYCNCSATSGGGSGGSSGGSGGSGGDSGEVDDNVHPLCKCHAGDWLYPDGTCTPNHGNISTPPNDKAVGMVYVASRNASYILRKLDPYEGCYVKAFALKTDSIISGQSWNYCESHSPDDEGYIIASKERIFRMGYGEKVCPKIGSNSSAYCYVPTLAEVTAKDGATGRWDWISQAYLRVSNDEKYLMNHTRCEVFGLSGNYSSPYYPHFIVRTSDSEWTSGDNGVFVVE